MESKSFIFRHLYEKLKAGPCTIRILTKWRDKHGYTFTERTLYHYLKELERMDFPGETLHREAGNNNMFTWQVIFDKSEKELNITDINTFLPGKVFCAAKHHQTSQGFV